MTRDTIAIRTRLMGNQSILFVMLALMARIKMLRNVKHAFMLSWNFFYGSVSASSSAADPYYFGDSEYVPEIGPAG